MTGDRKRFVSALALVVAALLAGGCVRVKPHQRAIHSKRSMQPDRDPTDGKLESGVHERREGSIGGTGVSGGGCGCN